MPALPVVSVIVPTHNRSRLLPLTLQSVLWQQGVELEVLVVDDGSTDDVRGVVDELDDRRFRVLRQEPSQGVCVARNRGVAEASGTWIAFVDDDDLWAPDKLVSQVRAAEEESRSWAYVGAVNVSEDLRLLGGAPPAAPDEVVSALPRVNLIPGGCSGVVVHRDLLPRQPFDPSCRYAEDWDLWIRLSRLDRPVRVGRPMVGYRVHGGNRSLDIAGMVAMLDVIDERYGGPTDRATFYRHIARVCQRASRHSDALRYYVQAAAADRHYRRQYFLSDLVEVAQGVGQRLRRRVPLHRLARPTANREVRPARRYAALRAWVEQARPWLDELAAHRSQRDRPTTCETRNDVETF
jgi:glycosyltransferase involved in cell wall biosynthesis